MRTQNYNSISYYIVSKQTFSDFYVIYLLFWFSYIDGSSSIKVNLTIKLINNASNKWITLSNHSFNTINFNKFLLYFITIINDNHSLEASDILFQFNFGYKHNKLNLTRSKKKKFFFTIKDVLKIFLFILCLYYILLYSHKFIDYNNTIINKFRGRLFWKIVEIDTSNYNFYKDFKENCNSNTKVLK